MNKTMATLTKYGATVATKTRAKMSTADISITSEKRNATLTIRNGLAELFENLRVSFVKFPKGKALFLIPDKDGYKLSACEKMKSNNYYYSSPIGSTSGKLLTEYVGDYDLQYDDNTGWYYIRKDD